MADELTKCSYEDGPCALMAKYHRGGQGTSPRSKGLFSLNNFMTLKKPGKFFHAGFFFRDPELTTGKGVMLNFCPWCGGNLEAWTNAALADARSAEKTG